MTIIEVFADISCPFTHFSLHRLAAARDERGVRAALRVRAWPLEWVNGKPLDPLLVEAEVDALRAKVAPDLFANFDPTTFPRTMIPAFGLATAAYACDDVTGEEVSLALRDALFEHGLDIADNDVIAKIAKPFGVEPLGPEAAASATRSDWERGKARGVKGSPHFFVGDHDWFCPSLLIRHNSEGFDVQIAQEHMHDFYSSVLG